MLVLQEVDYKSVLRRPSTDLVCGCGLLHKSVYLPWAPARILLQFLLPSFLSSCLPSFPGILPLAPPSYDQFLQRFDGLRIDESRD